jgi:hypothetical protein
MSQAPSTTLLFLAPPDFGGPDADDSVYPTDRVPARTVQSDPWSDELTGPPLRMLRAAREAAEGMKVTDAQVRALIESPEHIEPDPTNPQRMRLRGNGLQITVGADGMILRVARKR